MSDSDDDNDDVVVETPKYNFWKSAKVALILAIIFIFMMTDVFVERVLERLGGGFVSDRRATTSGVVAQALILTMSAIIVDYLISTEKI
jgi:hypothetical protein